MFLLFKHRNNIRKDKKNPKLDMVAEIIVTWFIKLQVQTSLFLLNKSERLSKKAKVFVVIIFCAISFSCSVYLILKSLYSNQSKSYSIEAIEVPKQLTQNEVEKRNYNKEAGIKKFEMLATFKLYTDSLTQSASGKKFLDSIFINRPGLIDSLTFLEHMYQLQSSKNK